MYPRGMHSLLFSSPQRVFYNAYVRHSEQEALKPDIVLLIQRLWGNVLKFGSVHEMI